MRRPARRAAMTRPVDLEEHARRRSAVRAGREAGESTRAIADRLGLGHSTLYSWIRDYAPDLLRSWMRRHMPLNRLKNPFLD